MLNLIICIAFLFQVGNNKGLHTPMARSKRFQAVGSTYGLPLPFKCRVACLMRSVNLLLSSLDCPLSINGHNNQDESGIHRIAALWSLRGERRPSKGGVYVALQAPLRHARFTFDWRASRLVFHTYLKWQSHSERSDKTSLLNTNNWTHVQPVFDLSLDLDLKSYMVLKVFCGFY